MKKIIILIMAAIVAVTAFNGCTSTGKNFFGIVKGVVIGDDYEAAGRMVGEAGYMAYVVMKGDPKYDKYTAKAEEIYAALDNAEGFDTASVNQIFLEVMQAALTAKYGYVKAVLITDGIRIGGVIADRLIVRKVSSADATLYVKGIKEGIDEARGAAITTTPTDTASLPNYITCKKGNKCLFTFTNRSTAVQLAIAKELDDYGFLDKSAVRKDPYIPTDAENVVDFIGLCEKMLELGVDKMKVWIAEVRINEDGKLESIKFLYEDFDGEIKETNCATCVM